MSFRAWLVTQLVSSDARTCNTATKDECRERRESRVPPIFLSSFKRDLCCSLYARFVHTHFITRRMLRTTTHVVFSKPHYAKQRLFILRRFFFSLFLSLPFKVYSCMAEKECIGWCTVSIIINVQLCARLENVGSMAYACTVLFNVCRILYIFVKKKSAARQHTLSPVALTLCNHLSYYS